ncbi:MAG: hypothetical protein RI933_992 [Actinomycetota bacterium]|jgi:hypothetical protein|uniref:Uncharacterized protein n=1 Tax=Candidatus Rhodoluna planktonica TaxID=535712 RepID=A0A1D9E0S7_9MICO|nr:hypothetical protein [Candidatus Rhodoluna planktonica]AOY56651.1 hypothetical protein A4Z71_06880 [Candidatus Rhodoluna planktonica]
MNEKAIQAELTAETKASVVSGLGYPAGRNEVSPTRTGWTASQSSAEITVSRETLQSAGEFTAVEQKNG